MHSTWHYVTLTSLHIFPLWILPSTMPILLVFATSSAAEEADDDRLSVQPSNFLQRDNAGPDHRSSLAMEDLGQMMLRMGINDRREPSFTVTPGQSNAPNQTIRQREVQPTEPILTAENNLNVLQNAELRAHLIACFCRYFNPFHQVFVPDDVLKLEVGDHNLHLGHQMRCSAIWRPLPSDLTSLISLMPSKSGNNVPNMQKI
ncbi:hypothetical protein DL98DRAFT_595847 [Cadophora sp. DSE1049]|nr:hypothetical protein DL98DRAFT_595847 [Cadophora sp. DSE1049]